MAFPLTTTGSELLVFPHDDAVTGNASNGQSATFATDYSGKGRNLTTNSNYPIYQIPGAGGKAALYWDGTKKPLANSSVFTIRCGFMVVRINEAQFSNYSGVLTDTAYFPILVGNAGTDRFYDNQQRKSFFYEYRMSDRIYPASKATAPMQAFRIIFFRYRVPIVVNGIQIGQDRTDASRKAKMSVVLLGLYSSGFNCEKDIRDGFNTLAQTFNLPLADVFPFYVENGSQYRDTRAANIDFPPSGGMNSQLLGDVAWEGDLKFAARRRSDNEQIRDYLRAHFGVRGFVVRSFAFPIPEDYFGYATSLLEYSADGKNCVFGFREDVSDNADGLADLTDGISGGDAPFNSFDGISGGGAFFESIDGISGGDAFTEFD